MLPNLNLLAPSTKKLLRRANVLLLVYEIIFLFFITSLLASTILLVARIMLEGRFQQIVSGGIPGEQKVAQINRNIRQINKKVSVLQNLTSGFPFLSPTIDDLRGASPQGVKWNSLTIDDRGAAIITGVAEKREDLIAFQNKLEALPQVQNIELPLQYLISENYLQFTITVSFDPKKLAVPPIL